MSISADKGWLYLPHFLSPEQCQTVLGAFQAASTGDLPPAYLGLSDSPDEANRVYDSTRSPGVRYCYLSTRPVDQVNRSVAAKLGEITSHDWLQGINAKCLPLFSYSEGAFIKAHRGRDIGYGSNDLVAVAMLTEPGESFEGGEFYLNPKAEASPDGKTVWNDNEKDRVLFPLERGSVLIFRNPEFVHATLPVRPGRAGCHRATVSWRISTPDRR